FLFRPNWPVRVHLSQMSLCFAGQILPVRSIRLVHVLMVRMSQLLPDCLFSFQPNRPVRVLH
ncbi:hypothetical protein KI387_020152, partial [Taxus chinensis]